jgi:hypothetical protein
MFNFIGATPTPSYHAAQQADINEHKNESEHEPSPPQASKPVLKEEKESTEPQNFLSTNISSNIGSSYRSQTVPPNQWSTKNFNSAPISTFSD